jgi:hypothetical protein
MNLLEAPVCARKSESNLLCPVVKTIHRFVSWLIEYRAMQEISPTVQTAKLIKAVASGWPSDCSENFHSNFCKCSSKAVKQYSEVIY